MKSSIEINAAIMREKMHEYMQEFLNIGLHMTFCNAIYYHQISNRIYCIIGISDIDGIVYYFDNTMSNWNLMPSNVYKMMQSNINFKRLF